MQRIFRSLAIVAVIALVAAPLAAEDKAEKKPVKGDPTAQALGFLKKVELTDEQKAKIEEIKAKHRPKLAEAQKEVSQILTPEARKTAAEARKQAQTDGKKGKDVQEAVLAALKLSEEDAAKYGKAQASVAAASTELRNEVLAVLTEAQRETAGVKLPKKKKAAAAS